MKIDRLSLFLGKPIKFNGVKLYSPTIEEIEEIGEIEYQINFLFSIFDKESILTKLFSIPSESYDEIEDEDDFEILVGHSTLINHICSSISFFVKNEIHYNSAKQVFCLKTSMQNGSVELIDFINKDNYKEFVEHIYFINGNEKPEKKEFKNDRVKKKYREMMKAKAQHNKGNTFDLKDVLSVLCDAEGNGINIFNVSNLTIYQVYERFERLNIKEKHRRMLKVWSNGLLKENDKLPEWITKTKL
jgi:hypothetical protein